MAKLDFQLIDIDHHYYEPDDCCTRHLEPRFADRAVHIGEYEGERAGFMGDRPLGFDRLVAQAERPRDALRVAVQLLDDLLRGARIHRGGSLSA